MGRSQPAKSGNGRKYRFSIVPDYFVNYVEVATSCPGGIATTQPRLGILDRDYDEVKSTSTEPQWSKFEKYLNILNRYSSDGESYKLFYIIRHGTGVHNIVMKTVGSESWKKYWSRLEGGNIKGIDHKWNDAHLIEEGIRQAERTAQLWVEEVAIDKLILPGTTYTSPLARALETTRVVYERVMKKHGRDFQPVVKEHLRERLTNHTCDRRSSKSWITKNFPQYVIEDGFQELDTYWTTGPWETNEEHRIRMHKLIEDIFTNDASTFVSLTTHSYAISAIFEAIGAPHFHVGEGAIVPLFVKAEEVSDEVM